MFSSTVIVSSCIECTGPSVGCSSRLQPETEVWFLLAKLMQNPRRKEEELQCNAAIMCSVHMLCLCAS